jgi:hypothetical protein
MNRPGRAPFGTRFALAGAGVAKRVHPAASVRLAGTGHALLPGGPSVLPANGQLVGNNAGVTDRAAVNRWLVGYEAAWRTAGTATLGGLFTPDATYLQSPYQEPVIGLDEIARMWDREREGPDEIFTLRSEIVAVDGGTAVVRVEVAYGDPVRQEYRDLWIIRFADDGRCAAFEEWPFWPGRPYAAGGPARGGE